MKDWNEIFDKALKAYHREYGDEAALPEGSKIAAVCENGVLILSSVNGEIECEIIEKVYKVD